MRRFRRSGGFRRKGTREPLHWYHGPIQKGTGSGSAGGFLTIFAADIVGTGFNQRLTIRRVRANLAVLNNTTLSTTEALAVGITKIDLGVPSPDPSMAVASDQEQDWLWFDWWLTGEEAAATAGNQRMGQAQNPSRVDVKAQRILESRAQLVLVHRMFSLAAGAPTGAESYIIAMQAHVLWQETRR